MNTNASKIENGRGRRPAMPWDIRTRFFGLIADLDDLGLRPPRLLLIFLNAVYQAYRRRVGWAWKARRMGLRVRELRTHHGEVAGIREFTTEGGSHTVVIREPEHRRFVGYTVEYPRYTQVFPPPFICRLDDAFVHVPSGGVIASGGTVIAESAGHKVERFLKLGPPPAASTPRPGTCSTLMHALHGNYYHWLIDCLSRTYLLAKFQWPGPIDLLVPHGLAPFQRQTLECCLPDNVRAREVRDEWVRAEHLILPSFAADPHNGFLPPDCLIYLREKIFQRFGLTGTGQARRRLYVSRARTGWRRVVNEEEIIDCLSRFGFETVRPEELSFEEQVRLFHSAEAVIGARGAGLTKHHLLKQA